MRLCALLLPFVFSSSCDWDPFSGLFDDLGDGIKGSGGGGSGGGGGYGYYFPSLSITVATSPVSEVGFTSATCGGIVQGDSLYHLERGVCWSTTDSPDTSGSHAANGGGIGLFTSVITNLTPGTTYWVRAYAINFLTVQYGNAIPFTTLANVTTSPIIDLSSQSATCGGEVITDGGPAIAGRGVCWSKSQNPTLSDNHTSDGSGTGIFTSLMTSLNSYTWYHVRAYRTTSEGTDYGHDIAFVTLNADSGTFTDLRDGQIYRTIKIGSEIWMADNLNFRTAAGSWYYADDSAAFAAEYGRLYAWESAIPAVPSGWHLPMKEELDNLLMNCGGSTNSFSQMTSGGTSGFKLQLGGYRASVGGFQFLGNASYLWTSSFAGSEDLIWFCLGNAANKTVREAYENKNNFMFSVRCVKN